MKWRVPSSDPYRPAAQPTAPERPGCRHQRRGPCSRCALLRCDHAKPRETCGQCLLDAERVRQLAQEAKREAHRAKRAAESAPAIEPADPITTVPDEDA